MAAKRPTRRQQLAGLAYIGGQKTMAEIGREFGVSRSAISKRLKRLKQWLAEHQRAGYEKALSRPGKRVKFRPMQINFAV